MIIGQNAALQINTRSGLMSELEASDLKGKVRKVSEENEYLPAHIENIKKRYKTDIDGKREISSITEYDEKGNRTKRDAYSSGRLFSKVVYGFLERSRISKEELITYGDEVFAVSPPVSTDKTKIEKTKDSRYAFKFTYKYDESGNRIEENWLKNTGDIWINDTLIYDKYNRVIEQIRRFRGEDKISSRVLVRYDDKGNLKEKIYINSSGEESEKHDSYEFDSQGNWIKHIVSKLVSKQTTYNPKGFLEPFLVSYRTITYF